MERQEIGRFYAKSFDGIVIEFIVYDDNTMSCPTLEIDSFISITLKPRFGIRDDENYSEYDVDACHNEKCQLIEDYDNYELSEETLHETQFDSVKRVYFNEGVSSIEKLST